LDEPRDGLEQRRLTAARGTEQHETIPAVDVETDLMGRANDPFARAVFEAYAVHRQKFFTGLRTRDDRRGIGNRIHQLPAAVAGSSKK
jgi:hypothetical protein